MLRHWLKDDCYRELMRARVQRQAYATAAVEAIRPSLFDWEVLDCVLRSAPPPDVIVVRRSELLDVPTPHHADEAKHLMTKGIGLVVRHAQQHEAGLSALVGALEQELGQSIHLQLFVTAAGTHGFGWHYDPDDVLILQTVGRKQYYFRHNTQRPQRTHPDFRAIERETSPLCTCTLLAGDALYLPQGMWHVARAGEDSLSMSLGIETSSTPNGLARA